MGLTRSAMGRKAAGTGAVTAAGQEKVIALAGNPNVGKSTVFNTLTGLHQHTGNWPGKTVVNATGSCAGEKYAYTLVDLPGTYSLLARSAEEETARDFLCFGQPDAVVVVCDATCLEHNLNLVLQILEITDRVLVCVNLLDEAKRKHIHVDLIALSDRLGVPVLGVVAREKQYAKHILAKLDAMMTHGWIRRSVPCAYDPAVEAAVARLEPVLRNKLKGRLNSRWLALRLLTPDLALQRSVEAFLGFDMLEDPEVTRALEEAREQLTEAGIEEAGLENRIVSSLVERSRQISGQVVRQEQGSGASLDRRLDRILTSRGTGYLAMLLLLALVFWLTISGANALSDLLAGGLGWLQGVLSAALIGLHAPPWLHDALILGVYRVVAWVVSVMLPPMAIFFPLFTLLEDAGYLPRVAYNLDRPFQWCSACGKQALTMCMGFGCNAAGVVGCRIIDSPRERLLAILTNAFVPCNGRFPALIAVLTMFFAGAAAGGLLPALLLTLVILLGVAMTFLATKLLSITVLKGIPSSFVLELPSYRKPQIGKVIVRSVLDRTLYVLGRAAVVAAPTGLVIWILANVQVGGGSLLAQCAAVLEPLGVCMGLDGTILLAFILGLPANEIVVPIILMIYSAQGSLMELGSLTEMYGLLVGHGWTWVTAICFVLFSLMHWPCSTTLLTIRKETGSWKWTAAAALVPTVFGVICCILAATILRFL